MPYDIPFGGNPLDRASNQRRDDAWLEGLLSAPNSRFLPFWRLNPLTRGGDAPSLGWLEGAAFGEPDGDHPPVLLGMHEGIAHFAVDLSRLEDPVAALRLDGATFADARGLATEVPLSDAGIIAQGRALLDWHARHRFCPACGGQTTPGRGGGMRRCESCGTEHFPRTDPVAIMVVWREDVCLLGRRPGRPAGNYSALAGFIEQGETIEHAVAREVEEEVGLLVDDVRYHASQPWPFPSSLMIGCFAHAASTDLRLDDEEIAEARWFTREEVGEAIAGNSKELIIPGAVAIAHHLIRHWAEGDVG